MISRVCHKRPLTTLRSGRDVCCSRGPLTQSRQQLTSKLPGLENILPMHSSFLQIFAFNTLTIRRLRHGGLSLTLVFALAAFLPPARAVTPAPDGGYPNGNTAEGDSALFSLSDGTDNVAIGAGALYSKTEGNYNTA